MSPRGHGAEAGRAELEFSSGSRNAIRNYASRNPWIELRELEQEAAVAALEARRDWRPDGGTSIDLWEAWIVGLALSRFVAETRVPVSLPKRKGEAWAAAASSKRVGLTSMLYEGRPVARFAAEQSDPLEDFIDLERAIAKLRGVLSEQSEAARAVLLAEEKSATVAERTGLSRREVYRQTERAVRALRAAFCPALAVTKG